jgi:uncharacterized protein (DUF305 family)
MQARGRKIAGFLMSSTRIMTMLSRTTAAAGLLALAAAIASPLAQAQDHSKHGQPAATSAPKTAAPAAAAPAAKVDHSKMNHAAATGADNASTKAFKAANDAMHAGMAIPFSGNADVDFVRGMIPHHEGAVAMAKIVLEHGKDAKIKKLARDIIKAQNSEIAMMKAWLAKNAKP